MRNTVRWTGALVALLVVAACDQSPTQPELTPPLGKDTCEIYTGPECDEVQVWGGDVDVTLTLYDRGAGTWGNDDWSMRIKFDQNGTQPSGGWGNSTWKVNQTPGACNNPSVTYGTQQTCDTGSGELNFSCSQDVEIEVTIQYTEGGQTKYKTYTATVPANC